jgi:hypothetical protein
MDDGIAITSNQRVTSLIRASSFIRHSSFGFRHSISIRGCLLSPKGIFSPEEQLVLHAYSHNPLGRF